MAQPSPSGQSQESLADEVRNSERLYVDAAVVEIRKVIEMEYYRLRGYAIEGGGTEIRLRMNLDFNFNPAARSVLVTSVPEFAPTPMSRRASISPPCSP